MGQRVAVLGTGIMGRGMALSLLRAGHEVAVWNRTAAKAQALADDGAQVAGGVAEAVAGASIVITMLYDADAVLGVARELPGALPDDAVWLQCSTIGVAGTAAVAKLAKESGLRLLDAPVLGTKQPAEQGKLTGLVSGPAELVDAVRPVLEVLCSKIVLAGDAIGQGTALKLACNAWLAALTTGVAQALALAAGQGLDGRLVLEALDGGPVNSPYAQLKGGAMLASEYPPSFALDNLAKDLELISAAADAAGVDATLVHAFASRFAAAREAGHGQDDIAAVYEGYRSQREKRTP